MMTLQEVRDRLAEVREELQFYRDEYYADPRVWSGREFDRVDAELRAERNHLIDLECELLIQQDFEDAVAEIDTILSPIQEEPAIEVVALPASDDWLDEELDAMIADPAGTRFLNENAPETAENSQETLEVTHDTFVPYFASYAHFVLWVIGQAVRGITYIRRIANELRTSTSSVGYAA